MLTQQQIEKVMYEAMRLATTRMPSDVRIALERALAEEAEEAEEVAKAHLVSCLKNAELSESGQGLVCCDTGFPLYFVKIGSDVKIEGGIPAIYRAATEATRRATAEAYLRPISSGAPGDCDVYGSQQHFPLGNLAI